MKIKIPKLIRLTNPLWVEKIESRETIYDLALECTIKDKRLNINDWECCIVGETLNLFDENFRDFEKGKGDKSYEDIRTEFHKGCKQCVYYSRMFHGAIVLNESIEDLENTLKGYEKHLKSKHKDIIKKVTK